MAINFFTKLTAAALKNNSLLCVGLDPTPEAVPAAFRQAANPILAWNRVIIEATADLVCAFKPNIAFYEALDDGLATLKATLRLIPPDTPVILDAKRGDIGSTAAAYARVIFDQLGVDAVTLSPYLGADSIAPFAACGPRAVHRLPHLQSRRGHHPGAAQGRRRGALSAGGAAGADLVETPEHRAGRRRHVPRGPGRCPPDRAADVVPGARRRHAGRRPDRGPCRRPCAPMVWGPSSMSAVECRVRAIRARRPRRCARPSMRPERPSQPA
ncbi:orotidine-5'-phosphate decarboxylase [Candidatus Amarolinea dominans]|uniref:orotidine-5'-phosphate decarboxylase n=1 Tax=Candidatus Amarolinea dominans TaxID=3140696 RepID=UPI0031CCB681